MANRADAVFVLAMQVCRMLDVASAEIGRPVSERAVHAKAALYPRLRLKGGQSGSVRSHAPRYHEAVFRTDITTRTHRPEGPRMGRGRHLCGRSVALRC
jgi:hypothetical protein